MSAARRAEAPRVLDVMCMTGESGAIGIPAAQVELVREDDGEVGRGPEEIATGGASKGAAPGGARSVPSIDLRPLLGARRDAMRRRLRVTASAGAFDVVTDAALSVRAVDRAALRPVPVWIEPFLAGLGARELLLDEGAAVFLADPEMLAEEALNGRR